MKEKGDSVPISYIGSYLSMGESLTVKRLLKSRGVMAERGDIIKPVIDVVPSQRILFISKALSQISVSLTAKNLAVVADAQIKKSKYNINID